MGVGSENEQDLESRVLPNLIFFPHCSFQVSAAFVQASLVLIYLFILRPWVLETFYVRVILCSCCILWMDTPPSLVLAIFMKEYSFCGSFFASLVEESLMERSLLLTLEGPVTKTAEFTKSVDPDEVAHYEPPHHCFSSSL